MRLAALLLPALALAACSRPKELYADHAWVRLPAVRTQPGAAYFTLHGGKADATLIAVSTDVAIRSELHESMAQGMRPVASVPVPTGSTVAFTPGGRQADAHLHLRQRRPDIAGRDGGRRGCGRAEVRQRRRAY